MAFAGHAHVHDEFSPLDGTGTRNQLTKQAVKNGNTHLGCTNHGRLGSVLDHIQACRNPEKLDDPDDPTRKRHKDERLIPAVGIEAFWRPNRFMDLTDKDLYGKNGHNWAQHLCVHAGSLNGWRTLMRLSSKSWVQREQGGGFYGKPCFDWEMLEEDNEDIIISTACLNSPLSQLILDGDESGAKKWLKRACKIVGQDRVWLEIMPHDLDAQRTVNIEKVNLGNELGLPFITTGDVHIPYKEWADTQSIVRMAAYKTTVSQQEKKSEAGEEIYTEEIDTVYMSSEQELREMYAEYHPDLPNGIVQESLDNTVDFFRGFRGYVIGKTPKLPKADRFEKDVHKTVREWVETGWQKKLDTYPESHWKRHSKKTYIERREYEWDVLVKKGVIDYFYIVGDFVRWAKSDEPLPGDDRKKRPIRVGLGRGSAAGCLISHDIGITGIDPISWGLLFERFLNPDRVGLPDIDIDFETEVTVMKVGDKELDGREMVIEYLRRKYGHDHVAAIIAYQTFAPRAVIKAVLQTQDWPFPKIQKITDSIGDTERGLEKIAKQNEIVAKLKKDAPELWEHMVRLEDQVLRDSRHAGGIVITDKPVTYYMPTQIGSDEESVVTAWADRAGFPIVSDYGFLKNDILGVTSLAKQELACQLIKDHYGVNFEPNDMDALRDPYATKPEVIQAFVQGLTVGIFQFGGRGITNLLRHIKPTSAIDIAVANALYRPGPIKIAFEYGDRKNGKIPESKWYWHDSLEPLLGETLGLIAFQEQVMEIVKVLGNFSGGEADLMRKAISKLYRLPGDAARQFMQEWHEKWMQGCRDNGLKDSEAQFIWDAILEFAGYGFNKSHSASYALQAIQDQEIKVFYPLAFYASLLTIEKKSKKEEQIQFLKSVMREASVFDIDVAPPDVNKSNLGWTIDGDKIRYGLVSISGLGSASAGDVIKQRPFKSFQHFITKMPSGFGTDGTVALAKAGAFDEMVDRKHLLAQTRKWPETVKKIAIVMDCKCKKSRTVKLTDALMDVIIEEFDGAENATVEEQLEMATELILDEVDCPKHEGAKVDTWEEIDPNYFVAAWYKDNPEDEPDVAQEPSQSDILRMEEEALNIPLSLRGLVNDYHDFIEERIFNEEEVNELPSKPQKKGKKHGTFCACDECEAASCVVGGEIINTKIITTKNKEKMAFLDVALGTDTWSVTMFPYAYKKYAALLVRPSLFLFAGHKQERQGQSQILMYEMNDVVDIAKAEGYEPPRKKTKLAMPKAKPKKAKLKFKTKVTA